MVDTGKNSLILENVISFVSDSYCMFSNTIGFVCFLSWRTGPITLKEKIWSMLLILIIHLSDFAIQTLMHLSQVISHAGRMKDDSFIWFHHKKKTIAEFACTSEIY